MLQQQNNLTLQLKNNVTTMFKKVVPYFKALFTVSPIFKLQQQTEKNDTSEIVSSNESIENWCTTKIDTVQYTLKWTIEDFSSRCEKVGQRISSSSFTSKSNASRTWQMHLLPNGVENACGGSVAIWLVVTKGCFVKAKYHVTFSNSSGTTIATVENARINLYGPGYGQISKRIVKRTFLCESLNADDKLILMCKITAFVDKEKTSAGYVEFQTPTPYVGLSKHMRKLFETATLADLILIAEGREISVHKAVLTCRSPVFAVMFKDYDELEMVINDVEFDVLKETLRFLYTDESPNLRKMADKLLVVANKYELLDLKALCEKTLVDWLTPERAYSIMKLAEVHGAGSLKKRAAQFVNENAEEIVKTVSLNCDYKQRSVISRAFSYFLN